MKMKTKINQGFTLIELMITVAIIGILAAIALPAYQDYTSRSQIVEAITMADGAKTFVVSYHSEKGVFPIDSSVASFPGASGRFLDSVNISDNKITAIIGGKANINIVGETIVLEAIISPKENIIWNCSSSMVGTTKEKYLPSSCRG